MAENKSVAERPERDQRAAPSAAGSATWRQRAGHASKVLMSAPGIIVRFARLFQRSRTRGIDETSLSPQSRAIYRQLSAAIRDRFVRQ